ncbi:MAG TPA: hypothetical protein VMN60_05180 [Longimicrobiales bacterium]|nr:hypothetical protein [Longimicrobiales bacterium]
MKVLPAPTSDGYLAKPVEVQRLAQEVAHFLRPWSAEQASDAR